MGRYRFHEMSDLMALRASTYQSLVLNEQLDYRLSAGSDRRTLSRIDREIRRRKKHETATPGGNA